MRCDAETTIDRREHIVPHSGIMQTSIGIYDDMEFDTDECGCASSKSLGQIRPISKRQFRLCELLAILGSVASSAPAFFA
jgi:hypothetical protein